MAKLLFKLNNVPEDEAFEVRQLLASNDVDYYETSAGVFGISLAAIWLSNNDDYESVKTLLDEYQAQRLIRARETWAQNNSTGEQQSAAQRYVRKPLQFLVVGIMLALVLFITVVPFLGWF